MGLQNKSVKKHSFYSVPDKNREIGRRLLIWPLISLAGTLLLYFVFIFIMSFFEGQGVHTLVSLIKVIFGFVGTFLVLAFVVGFPFSIIFLNKKELNAGESYDNRSGQKDKSIIPEEIKGWNWGAAGFTWIWGVYYSVWISLLTFIPVVNIIMIFVLGKKGNEWAWRSLQWRNTEDFMISQKKWKLWGIIFLILNIILYLLLALTK